MAPSIEELDATVRGFYEGRGEPVSTHKPDGSVSTYLGSVLTRCVCSKKLLKHL